MAATTNAHPDHEITNFVFDMGGVLMDFNTKIFSHLFVENDEDAQLIDNALYSSSLWPLLDAGVISEQTIEYEAKQKLPERLWEPLQRGFAEWEQHQPIFPEMNDLVVRLHEAGYGCYLLSNAGTRWWHQKERIPSFKVMDGFVVSAFERLMKPDPLIYTTLCERYRLEPASCLFVDDNAANCRGAERVGMSSYHYDGEASHFENFLHENSYLG